MRLARWSAVCLLLGVAIWPLCAAASRCQLNGVEVNTDNGSTTAGKTGMLKCYRPDGTLQREQELRDGAYLGLDRMYRDDGTVSERQVNANGNTQGVAREFFRDGTLKHEATYENGAAVGLSKSMHPNGRIASLSFFEKPGAHASVTIEYNADGQLSELRCGASSLIAEDRAPCGFGGKSIEVDLYTSRGLLMERRSLRDGKLIRAQAFDRDGKLTQSTESTEQGRVERSYHSNGQPAHEALVAGDFEIAATEWYMNGKLKSKITREAALRDAKSVVERYRDTGVLQSREHLQGERRLRTEQFDDNGRLAEDFAYADDGRLQTHRKFAADGRVTLEEEFYPDGSRKAPPSDAKIAN